MAAHNTGAIVTLQTLARALGGDIGGQELRCPGPGHSAADRSMTVMVDNAAPDGFIVHSFSKDDPLACKDYIRTRLNLPAFEPRPRKRASDDAVERALMAAVAAPSKPKGKIVEIYPYTDADRTLLYQVLRYEPKMFRQRRPDGNGGWIWKLDDRRVIYHLPELREYPDATVFITEGEKDANRLWSVDLCATCVAAGKWTDECVQALAGRDIIILPDNDRAGREKAQEAAHALHGTARSIRVVALPGLPEKGDVSDWLDGDRRRNGEMLGDICWNAPEWSPHLADDEPTEDKTPNNNADEGKPTAVGLPFIDMSNWDDEPVPDQAWAVQDRISLQQCVLFTGEGAAGKSTIQLHLSAAHVLGRDWLGTLPEPGPAIYIDAEDGKDILHRRLAAIAQHYQASFRDLIDGGLHLIRMGD